MHWLVTTMSADRPTFRRYLAWLDSAGIGHRTACPSLPRPEDGAGCDALLLSGGDDVDPARFGQPVHSCTAGISAERDRLEIDLVLEYRRAGRPVFGICRGIQVLQVALGGPLVQHVPDLLADGPFAGERHAKDRGADAMHGLCWTAGTRLGDALGRPSRVNSAHHQAVDAARLAPGLRVCAASPGGIVEAVEGTAGPPLYGVQWHPERMPDPHDPAGGRLLEFWASVARNRG